MFASDLPWQFVLEQKGFCSNRSKSARHCATCTIHRKHQSILLLFARFDNESRGYFPKYARFSVQLAVSCCVVPFCLLSRFGCQFIFRGNVVIMCCILCMAHFVPWRSDGSETGSTVAAQPLPWQARFVVCPLHPCVYSQHET